MSIDLRGAKVLHGAPISGPFFVDGVVSIERVLGNTRVTFGELRTIDAEQFLVPVVTLVAAAEVDLRDMLKPAASASSTT